MLHGRPYGYRKFEHFWKEIKYCLQLHNYYEDNQACIAIAKDTCKHTYEDETPRYKL